MKDTVIAFFSDLLAVILGIVITFAIQDWIDRAADRKDVRSALELVRTELLNNRDDLATMSEYLDEEKKAAEFFIRHHDAPQAAPADSAEYLGSILFADAYITVSNDALELLKSSSLLPKIGDNLLSMKIIRAYDSSSSFAAALNRHIASRDAHLEQSEDFLKSDEGLAGLRWLVTQYTPEYFSDIDEALSAIESYLK